MSNVFKNLEKSTASMIIVIFPLAVALCVISVLLMYEDLMTSYYGYLSLPTAKVNRDWIPWCVALLPQLGQIVMASILFRDTRRRRFAGILAIAFFVIDAGTDTAYKSQLNWQLVPLSLIETVFIYTLGSEVMFSLAAGFLAETFGEFIAAFGLLLKSTTSGLAFLVEAILGKNDEESVRLEKSEFNQRER